MARRILSSRLDTWIDPAAAFVALHGDDDYAFWLDSGADATSGKSFLGRSDQYLLVTIGRPLIVIPPGDFLDESVPDFFRSQPFLAPSDIGAVPLGWVGYLGYDIGRELVGLDTYREFGHPDAAFLYVDRLLAFDHAARTVHLVAVGEHWTGELDEWRRETKEALGRASEPEAPPPAPAPRRPDWVDTDDAYLDKIARCQAAIHDGDAYQLCLTTEVTVEGRFDPLGTYLALRASSPSHHGGLLRIGGLALLSASPEKFLSVSSDGIVESSPIKGTRPRGSTPADDDRLRIELAASEKERAENLMIVDLMRNDIGRVCDPGSVTVPSLLEVQTYPHVHQLVSTVRGQLAAGRHPFDAVEACLPAGSMTGAPKRRAMELLSEIEGRVRGAYSGAFGYLGLDGSIDLAVVIRSIVLDPDRATIGTGGGITSSSVPTEELAEMKLKAAALLAALGARPTVDEGS